jgi:hypothetical protein
MFPEILQWKKMSSLQTKLLNHPPPSTTKFSARASEHFNDLSTQEQSEFIQNSLGNDVYVLIRELQQQIALKNPNASNFDKNQLVHSITLSHSTMFLHFDYLIFGYVITMFSLLYRLLNSKQRKLKTTTVLPQSAWRIFMEWCRSTTWSVMSSRPTTRP